MAQIIPLKSVPNQTMATPVGTQNCELNIYQKSNGLYMDVFLDGAAIIRGVICQNENRIIRDLYLGFAGDFAFFDTEGASDPDFTGLGVRYILIYIEAADLPAGVG